MSANEATVKNSKAAAARYLRAWARLVRAMRTAEAAADEMHEAARAGALGTGGGNVRLTNHLTCIVGQATIDAVCDRDMVILAGRAVDTLLGTDEDADQGEGEEGPADDVEPAADVA